MSSASCFVLSARRQTPDALFLYRRAIFRQPAIAHPPSTPPSRDRRQPSRTPARDESQQPPPATSERTGAKERPRKPCLGTLQAESHDACDLMTVHKLICLRMEMFLFITSQKVKQLPLAPDLLL